MGTVEAGLPVGERLAMHRRRRGLTQRELGELVGRTGEWVRKVESGQHEIDRVSVLRRVEATLNAKLLRPAVSPKAS
jgi:transcriptional regulator with XRE-family HTH domain